MSGAVRFYRVVPSRPSQSPGGDSPERQALKLNLRGMLGLKTPNTVLGKPVLCVWLKTDSARLNCGFCTDCVAV